MARQTLVPDPGEVVLEHLKLDGPDQFVMVLRAAGKSQTCPVGRRRSAKIHSRYRRHLSDLSRQGVPVRIELRVRRFFCGADGCRQRIFTEGLPGTVKRYGRRTLRLSELLSGIGTSLGGAGECGWHGSSELKPATNTASSVAEQLCRKGLGLA